ncbi:melanophilin isoform X2 [Rhinatrema bivittatum]|uniref:melanophilin isoform X2 n=1 Tax=Rhinatrema bivittatum TaxID=194408 RepID=UPI00112C47FF|nr:melanophilin isoform X2 [Rhinatrema bivittatum]
MMGRKLDLSKLTEEEAQHVLTVVQRDFDLRKKEEDRLEDLKCKVEKESIKRELLSNQAHLNETHCVHCLHPFKFLVNSKRQCQDCHFYTCKNCSLYNKKDQSWVCDSCCIARVMKTGSLEWYYDHVRSRFKHFGSAKVMRSLYGRLQHGENMGLQDRVYSLPNIISMYQHPATAEACDEDVESEDDLDSAEAQPYSLIRKTKRLLSVHPFDFELDSEYSSQSHRQSVQLSPAPIDHDVFQSFSEFEGPGKDTSEKESMIAEAELAAMFHNILQEQGQTMAPPGQEFSTEVHLPGNSSCLDKNDCRSGSPTNEHQTSQYSADMDTSDEEIQGNNKVMAYQTHHARRRSRASSQESVHHSGSQISDLNKRMYAIERMLYRLEERIYVHSDESPGLGVQTSADLEEETLKKKLEELASNISEKETSSEEVEKTEPRAVLSSSSDDLPNEAQKIYMAADRADGLEKKLQDVDHAQQSRTTDSELSGLEDKVASAAAQVQHTESEVSYIKSRIAALSAAGLTVTPAEKTRKKSPLKTPAPSTSRNMEPFQDDQTPEVMNKTLSSNEVTKVLFMEQALRRKFNISNDIPDGQDTFDRNALYRGSLTQRNPNGKNRKADRIFAKPVMSHR